MKSIAFLLLCLFVGIVCGYSSASDSLHSTGIPELFCENLEVVVKSKDLQELQLKSFTVYLTINSKNRIVDYRYQPESVPDLRYLKKAYGNLGLSVVFNQAVSPYTITIPCHVTVIRKDKKQSVLLFELPGLSSDITSQLHNDSSLVAEYFRLNNIEAPGPKQMPSLSYLLPENPENGKYTSVTALVRIDENGKLEDISFPFECMRKGKHQIFTALLNAEFKPLVINGIAMSSSFFVTIRQFDNIKYPFQPVFDGSFDSTAIHTEMRFCSVYLTLPDFSQKALPREFADLIMPASGLSTRAHSGYFRVEAIIDEAGQVISVSGKGVPEANRTYLKDITRRLTFYPAMDEKGDFCQFTGKIQIIIDGNKKVVYNPEWLR